MKIVVTGAAGFIGSWLAEELGKIGHDVYSLDDLSGGFPENYIGNVNKHVVDLANMTEVENLFKLIGDIDILVHLAADASEGRSFFCPVMCTNRNYLSLVNVLTCAIRSNVKRVVATSSMAVYGEQDTPFDEIQPKMPVDVYGINKAALEDTVECMSKIYNYDYVILRPHNVYGERQNLIDPYRNVIGIFIKRLIHGQTLYVYGNGEQRRAFSYIDDVLAGLVQSVVDDSLKNEIINIGAECDYSINDVVAILKDVSRCKDLDIKNVPDRFGEVKDAYCTIQKSIDILGYKDRTTLREGINNMYSWALKFIASNPDKKAKLIKLELDSSYVPETWRTAYND